MESCIYEGWIRHRRFSPQENHFRIRISLIYLALEELDQIFAGRWLWSTRRLAVARFRRSDYLGPPSQDLRTSVSELIAAQGGSYSGGPIRLLTHFRYWGLGFNPVSFYYCYSKLEPSKLECVVAEVTNTPWGQKHAYVLGPREFASPNRQTANPPVRVPKTFHVSPFMDQEMEYQFAIVSPREQLSVSMANWRRTNQLFAVDMQLSRRPITTLNLMRVLVRFPAMTLQVVGHIYFQALRLWWKGIPFVPHPEPGQQHGNLTTGKAFVKRDDLSRLEQDRVESQVEISNETVGSA